MSSKSKISNKLSQSPDESFSDDVIQFIGDNEDRFFPGDVLEFSYLKPKFGLKLNQAKAIEMPDYDNRDEDVYLECDAEFCLSIQAERLQYPLDKDGKSKQLEENIKKWIILEDWTDEAKILDIEVVKTHETFHEVSVKFICEYYAINDDLGNVTSSPFLETIWVQRMEKLIVEGVCYIHGNIPTELRTALRRDLDYLAKNTNTDYHPNSNDIVRDLVHPALYPFIKGISKLNNAPDSIAPTRSHDFWERPYENSKFQWLPTPFQISEGKKCTIQEYVNNLDRDRFSDLYTDLEKLFEVFLPYFEDVWSYVKAITFFRGEDHDDGIEHPVFNKEVVSFAGMELQVIVKIVEYNLQPGQSYEGVWHAEGMSHENIVMTGIYFLDRDLDIKGGDLQFKRAFTQYERNKILYGVPQSRPQVVDNFAVDGLVPLGSFPTDEGYMLVFPNCHIHKISKMINSSSTKSSSRRIVVFFVINPECKIISTREVSKQQDQLSLVNAKRYRLELMAERKYNKDKLNEKCRFDYEACTETLLLVEKELN